MLKRSLLLLPSRTPLYQAKLGFYLLIASLGMFFAASLITYITIRMAPHQTNAAAQALASDQTEGRDIGSAVARARQQAALDRRAAGDDSGDADGFPQATHRTFRSPLVTTQKHLEPLEIPQSFYFSTLLLVGISLSLHFAVVRVSQERQPAFRRNLLIAAFFALLFLVVQNFGMADLLGEHFASGNGSTKMYGIAFTLALIHALHVYGGLAFLGVVVHQAFKNRFDHERHWSVDICASYWHFLDVVWIAMLITFVVTA